MPCNELLWFIYDKPENTPVSLPLAAGGPCCNSKIRCRNDRNGLRVYMANMHQVHPQAQDWVTEVGSPARRQC